MSKTKKETVAEKSRLHPRNAHRARYDFALLTQTCPDLLPFVKANIHGDTSIDFANPLAVKTLNRALLQHYYKVENWDIPEGYLCPPIPGRADYIHHIADLLCASNYGKMPEGSKIKVLDIGVGANCVYPLIGHAAYGWSFIGSDIDAVSLAAAQSILTANPHFQAQIECRLQPRADNIFYGVLARDERIDLSICNPPFHPSQAAADAASIRKVSNLTQTKVTQPALNFGGQNGELWCEGGELAFIQNMIKQSRQYLQNCFWFSTLVSKSTHLKSIYKTLENAKALEVKTLPMGQGNKTSRIVAWTFLTKAEQKSWKDTRWV